MRKMKKNRHGRQQGSNMHSRLPEEKREGIKQRQHLEQIRNYKKDEISTDLRIQRIPNKKIKKNYAWFIIGKLQNFKSNED